MNSVIAERVAELLPDPAVLESLSGPDLDAVMLDLERAARKIEAAKAAVVGRSDRSARYLADGHRNALSWTMAVTNCSRGEAVGLRRAANAMTALPEVAAEFRAGRVGVAQVRELGRLVSNPRCGELVAGSEQVLLAAAKELQCADFLIVTRRWEQLADADGAHRKHQRRHESRNATLAEVDGEYQWRTSHGAIAGSAMQQVFDKFVEAEFLDDWEAARAEHGDLACKDLLRRTAAQRRADALLAIFRAAATAGVRGGPFDVVVNLVCDQDSFEQHLGNAIDGTPVVIDPASVLERRCESVDGVPVDPAEVVAAAVVGHVRRVVFDSSNVIVNAGRKRRLFTGPIREVLKAVEPRCIWLGCLIRAAIAQLDHAERFASGGTTDARYADIECGHHNLFIERSGYTPVRTHDGRWIIQRPDGTLMQPPDAA